MHYISLNPHNANVASACLKKAGAAAKIPPMQSFKRKLEHFSIILTPAVLTVFMVLLAAVPLHIAGAAQLMPLFALISIYYWNTFAPGLLPYAFLLALGLLEDTLRGMPLGISCVIYIVFALLISREQKSFGRAKFGGLWVGFALLSLIVLLLEWCMMSFYWSSMLPFGPHLLEWLMTCLAYPPVHFFLARVRGMLME